MSVSIINDDLNLSSVTSEDVVLMAAKSGIVLPKDHAADWAKIMASLDKSAQKILAMDDYLPKLDLERYPRTDIHIPEDTVGGGWAVKVNMKSTAPLSDELKGRTIAIKDNVAIAGILCTNGTAALPDWVPTLDATIVTRILDAGGFITGKAACENGCYEGTSESSITGIVDNPWAKGYSAGGSSSGSAALVAAGAVDMSIGCDQGGSIRMPASFCGIVGLKPTWGLVPYTGIIGLDPTIDHVGPMTKDVRDCALLLEAIAGADHLDDRQQFASAHREVKYATKVDEFLAAKPTAELLKGIKIGILDEGFGLPSSDPNVDAAVKAAAEKFKSLGAEVTTVSVPSHKTAGMIWGVSTFVGSYRQTSLGDVQGRKLVYMTDRVSRSGVGQKQFDASGMGVKNMMLSGMFIYEKYGPKLYAQCMNLLRELTDNYNTALQNVDILVMPTLPFAAPKHNVLDKPLDIISSTLGMTANTSPYDATGHPAISIPVGFVPAKDDASVKLPVGMMLVGRKFEEVLLLQVAGAWEKGCDWKSC